MEYLIGLLTGVVFLLVFFGGIFAGTRLNNTKHKPPDVDEEEKRNIKKFNEDFKKIMSYDERVARLPKKVN